MDETQYIIIIANFKISPNLVKLKNRSKFCYNLREITNLTFANYFGVTHQNNADLPVSTSGW